MVLDEIGADFSTSSKPVATSSEMQAEDPDRENLSNWSRSSMKRIFDCICVLCSLPVALPILFATSIAVMITSRGPIFFDKIALGAVRSISRFSNFAQCQFPQVLTHGLR